MKHVEEYRDAELVRPLMEQLLTDIAELENECGFNESHPLRIMEVCGTHTMAIFKSGLKSILPKSVELVSGPGCPVCVTDASHIDSLVAIVLQEEAVREALQAAGLSRVRLTCFGDMFRVPGSHFSLAEAAAQNGDSAAVQIVYSPMDALETALQNPDELVIFAGVGFETTAPAVAATLLTADKRGVENFLVFPCLKTMIAPLQTLFADEELRLDALLCPGHVATIIGVDIWQELAERYRLASVVAGFETADLIEALLMICRQIRKGIAVIENGYPRAVKQGGNLRAQRVIAEVFEPCDMLWRGLGVLAGSGLAIREKYRAFDAGRIFPFVPDGGDGGGEGSLHSTGFAKGCRCGEVLRGRITPLECPLFGKKCTPLRPVGPCMVSGEGVCAAHYKYS